MPKLYYRKARTDRHKYGKIIPCNNKQGFKVDKSQSSETVVDVILFPKGQYYYTWHPKGSSWQFSKEKPDLRPEWEKTLEDFQSRVSECTEGDGDSDDRESLFDELNDYRDSLQYNLDNIPEQLQESSVLNERIEELDSLIEQISW